MPRARTAASQARRVARALACICCVSAQPRADIRVDVGLVTVTCSVTDRSGVPTKKLRLGDFTLHDNGKAQRIEHLWQEADLPLTIGLIVDVSGSQAPFVDRHRHTVAQFLENVLGPKDHAFVVTVASDVKLVNGIDNIDAYQTHGQQFGEPCRRGCGGTALWNAVYAAASQKMRWVQGRKALIVLSDGLDTGSEHSLADAIESAQDAEAMVYAIKYVDPALPRSETSNRNLERLTDQTGGFTFPNPDSRMAEVFARIEDDLRNLYVLAFTPPAESRDGRFHKLDVRVARRDLIARARVGYYARLQ